MRLRWIVRAEACWPTNWLILYSNRHRVLQYPPYQTERLEQALSPAFAPTGGFAGFWSTFQAILRDTVPGIRLDSVSEALQSLLRSVMAGDVQVGDFVTRTISLLGSSVPRDVSLERLRTALTQFGNELAHPGFTLTGRVGLLPIPSWFRVTAPTTVPLARPLLGAPAAFPISSTAYGTIIAPPGSLFSVPAPAFGFTTSSFGATTGTSFTAAALPTLDPLAISAGKSFVEQFPAYAYAEFSHVRRISNHLDLGLRLTVQVSTPQLFGPQAQPSTDPAERFQNLLQNYRDATQPPGSQTPPTPNIGLTVFGRFNAL